MTTTLGEARVRITFNPSDDSMVHEIKQRTAALIDFCAAKRDSKNEEALRLWSLAMTHYEDAAMWAVKAATIRK
jgi:hypothetical protein